VHCIIIDLSVLFFILTLSLLLLLLLVSQKGVFIVCSKSEPRGPHSSRPTNNSSPGRFCTQPAAHFSSLVRALPLKIKNNTLSAGEFLSAEAGHDFQLRDLIQMHLCVGIPAITSDLFAGISTTDFSLT
jgi:hypothetical protein